ncbi:hypothetical protein M3Y99_01886600 [Aphelenchoides fujianensis]|nr:hypothetical protein M3Y99_01886600 [Aphelenchoides fujianensis]
MEGRSSLRSSPEAADPFDSSIAHLPPSRPPPWTRRPPFVIDGVPIFWRRLKSVRKSFSAKLKLVFEQVLAAGLAGELSEFGLYEMLREHGLWDELKTGAFVRLFAQLRPNWHVERRANGDFVFRPTGEPQRPIDELLEAAAVEIPLEHQLEGRSLECDLLDVVDAERTLVIRPVEWAAVYAAFKRELSLFSRLFVEGGMSLEPVQTLHLGQFVLWFDAESRSFFRAQVLGVLRRYHLLNIRLLDEPKRVAVKPDVLFDVPLKFRRALPFCLSFTHEPADLFDGQPVDQTAVMKEGIRFLCEDGRPSTFRFDRLLKRDGGFVYAGAWAAIQRKEAEVAAPNEKPAPRFLVFA